MTRMEIMNRKQFEIIINILVIIARLNIQAAHKDNRRWANVELREILNVYKEWMRENRPK